MTDREEREEHIKRLEAVLACEEKQSSGKCSKQTCDDNCALLYEQGNWGEWKETLRYAINSLKIDLKYDLLYEETSGQKEPSSSEIPTDSIIDWNNCHTSEQLDSIATTKNDLAVDAVSREAVNELVSSQRLDTFSDGGRKWANIKIDVILRGLKELPSVTPQEPKTGHWIRVTDKTGHLVWECDKCGWQQRFNTNYCPDCGSDNREVEE